jgi:hypothetical protein
MNSTVTRIAGSAVMALAILSGSGVAQAPDRLAGTWALNVARSRFAGPPPKSQTTVMHAMGGGLHEVVDRVNADGTTTQWEIMAMYDGKEYPVTGDPARDTVALTKVDDYTVDVVNRKAGTVVNTMRIVVAPDGRTRTNTAVTTDSTGRQTESVIFFDRQ